jgi:hypothetical protein
MLNSLIVIALFAIFFILFALNSLCAVCPLLSVYCCAEFCLSVVC